NENYRDNYWEILPIEPIEIREEVRLSSEEANPNFIRAEEKATKAIQKHSMDVGDVERNPQTADAFILLGKARYYDQRFVPALESFNYVLRKFDQNKKLNEAAIWREKTNVRLENEELALKNLRLLMKFERLNDQEYADAHATISQIYLNLKAPDTAMRELKIAAAYTPRISEKGRYLFIIGQLYNELGHKDSANFAFDRVIALNRRSPRVYMINAHLQKIRNTAITAESKEDLLEYLTDLEEDRENRPFLDKIYHEIAVFHAQNNSDSLAIAYYNKSLRASQVERRLNALNYEHLADYYFDENKYKTAGGYYDSLLQNLDENTKKHRIIGKKLDNLEDVIAYEEVAEVTDSIIQLFEMPETERQSFFETYVADLKAKAEAEAEKKEQQAATGFAAFGDTPGGKENQGKFYFYNITTLGYGRTEFTNRWGNRTLEDDWRWSDKTAAISQDDITDVATGDGGTQQEALTDDQRYSVDYYLEQIPTDIAVIDSLRKERNFANYQLGLIYKEKFKEDLLAAGKLENVLDSDPEERLVLPSKYNLYKIYEAANSPLAETMKQNIIENHPDSRYTEILLNPQAVLAQAEDSPEARYSQLYKLYEDQRFLDVITGTEKQISAFTGEPIVPKFEMLKANAIGRLQGFEQFKEALNYVALNYPNNAQGKKAQDIIENQLSKLEAKEFVLENGEPVSGNWKVVFPFKRHAAEEAQDLMEVLEKSIKDLRYNNRVSKDIYNLEEQFIIVHDFRSKEFALGYLELLKNNKDYRIDRENFVVLSANYKIIQVHKNLPEYKNTILTPKP
ncbi:MAG: hypothetical protein HKN89_09625, partial [Eudoraea sp.]|nr:hypothetical protein [Eudoraea sp.]